MTALRWACTRCPYLHPDSEDCPPGFTDVSSHLDGPTWGDRWDALPIWTKAKVFGWTVLIVVLVCGVAGVVTRVS